MGQGARGRPGSFFSSSDKLDLLGGSGESLMCKVLSKLLKTLRKPPPPPLALCFEALSGGWWFGGGGGKEAVGAEGALLGVEKRGCMRGLRFLEDFVAR